MEARAAEDRKLGAIYNSNSGPRRWDGVFRVPLPGEITTQFGTHRPYEYHPGADIAAPMGAILTAPANGVAVFEGDTVARGKVLILDHGAGVYTTYAHLQRVDVDPGQEVSAGQPIAHVGTSGFSTGPHLHWELWVNGADVDPLEWTKRAFP
jgi:murein DD-endopeptidase MepM/ murein hydrolase activator NlpD